MTEPKTERSRRTMAALKSPQACQLEDRLRYGPTERDLDLVFTNRRATPERPQHQPRLRGTADEGGLPIVSYHAFRHTHATLLLAAGVPVVDVSARLGHSSPSITMDVYGHVMPDAGRGIARRLEALLA